MHLWQSLNCEVDLSSIIIKYTSFEKLIRNDTYVMAVLCIIDCFVARTQILYTPVSFHMNMHFHDLGWCDILKIWRLKLTIDGLSYD